MKKFWNLNLDSLGKTGFPVSVVAVSVCVKKKKIKYLEHIG